MFLSLFQVLVLALFLAWNVFLEYLDWHGRVEVLKDKHPKVYRIVHNRPMRLTLLLLCLAYLAKDFRDSVSVALPPVVSVKTPPPPAIQIGTMPELERPDSLRRRTMQLADEIEKYIVGRAENPSRPRVAIPDPRDPNPSEEQKEAIKKYQQYEQETVNHYSEHFKGRMIGIIREYNLKGVDTGFLEQDARQRPPIFIVSGSVEKVDLDEFRELAYHVDSKDNLIVISL